MTNSRKIANTFIITFGILALLIFARGIILPFVIAIFVWLIIRSIRHYLLKIKLVRRYVPTWILNIIAMLLIFVVIFVFASMLLQNLSQLTDELPKYQENFRNIVSQLDSFLGVNTVQRLRDITSSITFNDLFQPALSSFSGFLATFVMVMLYVFFLLLEENAFGRKLDKLLFNGKHSKAATKISESLSESVESYIFIKTAVNVLTGLLCYIALVAFGIDFAFFWAFLIFATSYIPNIGAFVGAIFPAVFALFQTQSLEVFAVLIVIFSIVQFVMGNVLEPRWMGKSMNLSTVVVLLSLAIWGSIWGVMGMILSVPLTMVISITLAQFPETEKIAMLLSEKGEVVK